MIPFKPHLQPEWSIWSVPVVVSYFSLVVSYFYVLLYHFSHSSTPSFLHYLIVQARLIYPLFHINLIE